MRSDLTCCHIGGAEGNPPWRTSAGSVSSTAPAAPLHVDDDLQYLYTPSDIALFEYVHGALSKVRELLNAERKLSPRPRAINSSAGSGEGRRSIPSSSPSGHRPISTRSCAWPKSSRTRRTGSPPFGTACAISKARASRFSSLVPERRRHSPRRRSLPPMRSSLSIPRNYGLALQEIAAAENRVREVSEALFAGVDLPGLFSSEWRTFITVAHGYGVAHVGSAFPDETEHCPYCRQALDAPALELLDKYRTYLVDDSQAELRSTQETVAALVSPVVDMTVPAEPGGNGDGGPDAGAVGRIRMLVLRQQQQLSDPTRVGPRH